MIKHLNKYIDHTLLKPEATETAIQRLCQEAVKYDFKSVCINPVWVKTAAALLVSTDVEVCTVIGFPLGANTQETKVFEARKAVQDGATEVDMVINIGALKDGNTRKVEQDIRAVVANVHQQAQVKVIIETCLLSDAEKVRACQAAVMAKADFVKTSTGFSSGGATTADVALMRETVGDRLGVKASGGVRTLADAQAMIANGATRIGTSHGVALMEAWLTSEK